MATFGGVAVICPACEKRVYETEKLTIGDESFHKWCLKCFKCSRVLGLGNYTSLDKKMYCKPHFIQLFKEKGNYKEGFESNAQAHEAASATSSARATQPAAAPAAAAAKPPPPAAAAPTPEVAEQPEPVEEDEAVATEPQEAEAAQEEEE